MEASTTRNFSCLGKRRLTPGAVVTLAEGGGQLVLEDTNSDVIRYLGGGVHCLIRGGERSSTFETGSAEFYGTVDEDPTCSSSGRIKHIDVRHGLVRDACDAGEVRGMCVKTRTCSLSRETYKSYISMRRQSSM